MCGRFQLEFSIEELDRYYNLIDSLEENRNDVKENKLSPSSLEEIKGVRFPSNSSLIIKKDKLDTLSWGFPYKNKLIINARGETLFEKSMYIKSANSQRCLIPANRFFEWKDKTKYNIAPEEGHLFSIAGIYNTFVREDGSIFESYVIITTEANEEMSKIHHRMPVIIPQALEYSYLSPKATRAEIIDLLTPYRKPLSIIPEAPAMEQLSLF